MVSFEQIFYIYDKLSIYSLFENKNIIIAGFFTNFYSNSFIPIILAIVLVIVLLINNSANLVKKLKPNVMYFVILLITFIVSLLFIDKNSEFLYFNF